MVGRLADRQTDRHKKRQTDRQTDCLKWNEIEKKVRQTQDKKNTMNKRKEEMRRFRIVFTICYYVPSEKG